MRASRPATKATRVLFLGGLGRSGTTLLERLLDREPTVQALGEVVHLWQRSLKDNELCGCGVPFDACPFWSRVGQVAFGGWDQVDVDRVLDLRDRVDRSRRVPRVALGAGGSGWRSELREYVDYYARVYAAAREVSGAEIVLDSSKQASLPYCLRTSDEIDLAVAHCVRDSRAVAYSWAQQVARPEGTSDANREMHRSGAGVDVVLLAAPQCRGGPLQGHERPHVTGPLRRLGARALYRSGGDPHLRRRLAGQHHHHPRLRGLEREQRLCAGHVSYLQWQPDEVHPGNGAAAK